jgi:hypothetical protein
VIDLTVGRFKTAKPKISLIAAVIVAASVTSYSLVDGVGVRRADSIISYISWLFTAEACIVLLIFSHYRGQRNAISLKTCLLGSFGGLLSATAYALVLYVEIEAPLGVVSALRETSFIFKALTRAFWLSEGPRR